VLPASVVLPTRVADDVSQAMRAWARWAAGRCDLPKRLRRRLLAELEDDLRDFGGRLAEANRAPERRYAEDLPDDVICDDTLSEEMLRRRYLAVPLPRERAEGAETLDPASPDGRSRITDLWLGERRIPRDRWASYGRVRSGQTSVRKRRCTALEVHWRNAWNSSDRESIAGTVT
jgi:hypothetical protein